MWWDDHDTNTMVLSYNNRIWWLYRSALLEWYKQLILPIDHYSLGSKDPTNALKNHTYWGLKITEACNPKMVFKNCEGISCSSFSFKELDVIINGNYFPCITMLNFGHSAPTSLANLVVEVGTWYSHQMLLSALHKFGDFSKTYMKLPSNLPRANEWRKKQQLKQPKGWRPGSSPDRSLALWFGKLWGKHLDIFGRDVCFFLGLQCQTSLLQGQNTHKRHTP